jgi:diguanylate cyclase (GGDEF)-like protein/PAS domain S-box-containing protein
LGAEKVAREDVLAAGPTGAKVLLVEDDPVSVLLLTKLFELQGILVDRTDNGQTALELHAENAYRLVISDWMMPGMDGIDLCRAFRQHGNAYVYFILCSAKGERADRIEAFEAGVDDFLVKPLDRDALAARLKVARRILETEDNLHIQKLELEHAGEALRDTNASLMHASKRFEELFSGMPAACFTFDEKGLVHEWNRQAEQAFQLKPYMAFQNPIWKLLGEGSSGFWNQELVRRVFAGDTLLDLDWTYDHVDGQRRYFACNVFGLRDVKGDLVGAISANLDITERKLAEQRVEEQMLLINEFAGQLERQRSELLEANARLEHLALTDGLTGLLNHRSFQETLEKAFERHRRSGKPLSMILLDIDHFKAYNDTFGHQEGDVLLRGFAEILSRTTRASEATARYGGEEFAIVLEECDTEDAIAAAERFRLAICEHTWPHRAVTASFGVSTTDGNLKIAQDLIRQADTALYASKDSGRNRVTHFDECGEIRAAA